VFLFVTPSQKKGAPEDGTPACTPYIFAPAARNFPTKEIPSLDRKERAAMCLKFVGILSKNDTFLRQEYLN